MEKEDMDNLPFNLLTEKNDASIFNDFNERFKIRRMRNRQQYPFRMGVSVRKDPKLTEVSTTDRKYTAGGISESMKSMSRAIKNEVVGFEVGDLSSFLRSSGKFSDMVSAVKNAKSVAGKIRKAVGKDKQMLDRNDPLVAEQARKANQAMAKVRAATEAYLQKKMTERHVTTYEELRHAGKSPYEQKRINYALGLIDRVKAYEKINDPDADKKEKKVTGARAKMARQRQAEENAKKKAEGPVKN